MGWTVQQSSGLLTQVIKTTCLVHRQEKKEKEFVSQGLKVDIKIDDR